MANNAIDSADALAKMSTRTGVSVEMLDKLKQAANLSDTSIDTVGKGLVKLGQSMVAADKGTGAQAKAFRELGISTRDANGQMRSIDDVMLDVADALKNVKDPATKASLAMDLMGRSGVEMIPMLDMGSEAINEFKSRISGDFARKAEEFKDKLTKIGERFGELGVKLAEGLMPALEGMADSLLGLIDAFVALPAPIQLAFVAVVGFGPQLVAIGKIFLGLITVVKSVGATFGALKLGAIVAGWLGAVVPALAAIVAAFKAFAIGALAVITGPVGLTVLAIAAIVAMAIAFRKPIMDFFAWLGGAIGNGLNALWQWGEPIRQFWAGVWDAVKGVVTGFLNWLGSAIGGALQALYKWGEPIRQFWVGVWEGVKAIVTGFFNWLGNAAQQALASLQSIWANLSNFVENQVIQPIRNAWNGLTNFLSQAMSQAWQTLQGIWKGISSFFTNNVVQPISQAWTQFTGLLVQLMSRAFEGIQSIWRSISGAFNQFVVQPISQAWTALIKLLQDVMIGITTFFQANVVQPIAQAWNVLIQLLPDAMRKAAEFVKAVWTGLVEGVKGVVRSLLQFVANAINSVGKMVNTLIAAFNQLPGNFKIAFVPTFTIPAFAKGGVVDKATLALIGENNEREYIVPESKMAAASSRYLAGARGSGVIPNGSGGAVATGTGQAPVINITTGPLMQFDGKEWVSRSDFEKGLQQVADAVIGRMRTPSARIALGRV
jgi:phage-related protein